MLCCSYVPKCEQQKRPLPHRGAKPHPNLASVVLCSLSFPSAWFRQGWECSKCTLTWSRVLQQSTNTPTGWVSCKLSFSSFSSRSEGPRLSSYQRGGEGSPLTLEGQPRKHSLLQIPGPWQLTGVWGGRASMLAAWEEMGRMLSWSSMTRHFLHEARERINLRNKSTVVRC